jgi:DEAD/DEAH box helicase domain-containing protein
VGLAVRLYERHAELVAGALALVRDCACEEGCPACTGPLLAGGGAAKQQAQHLLALLHGTGAVAGRAA